MRGLIVIFSLMLTLSSFAAPQFINFSTKGVDTYADGTAVVDGECYALVRVFKGKTFAGFAANGREADAETGKIYLTVSVAKDGHCPNIIFQFPDGFSVKAGTWSVYLLDTRKFINGKFSSQLAGIDAEGYARQINSFGVVSGATISAMNSSVCASLAAATGSQSVAPEGCPQAEITAMKLEGENVRLTIKNTVPYLQYNIAASSDFAEEKMPSAVVPKAGAANADETIELVVPRSDKASEFFSVIRN